MFENPFKSDFFDPSSFSSSDKTLHFYSGSSVSHIPVKYFMKSSLDSEDLYYPKTFYLRASESTDYDLEFLDIHGFANDSLLQTPIKIMLEEISEERAGLKPEPPPLVQEFSKQKDLWTTKYMPKRFDELLSEERINREVLCWLKAWDPIVFPERRKPKTVMPLFLSPKKPKAPNPFVPHLHDKQHQSFAKKTFNFINFDLDDPNSLHQMQNNVLLLAGPPGTGKTTLARIVATHCGYNPIEINASDDRTAGKLIEKIESACQSHSLTLGEKENKPSLIILDEVDGTADYEGKGTMKMILDYIFKGEKKAADQQKKKKQAQSKFKDNKENSLKPSEEEAVPADSETLEGNQTQANQKDKIQIKRPIIFICNDIYAKGLRELRKKAIVFHFRKTSTEKMIGRLREICQKEKVLIDHETMIRLCEINDNDIRSCLNTLELISRNRREAPRGSKLLNNLVLKDHSLLSNKKENTKSCLDVMEDLVYRSLKNDRSFNLVGYCLGQISRNVEYQILYETIFFNYTKIKQCERDFEKMVSFLVLKRIYCFLFSDLSIKKFMAGSENIETNIKRNQLFELTKFTMLPCVFFNLAFAGNEKIKIEFPYKMTEFKKESKISMEKLRSIIENYPLRSIVYLSPGKITMDLFSNIFPIIQPNLTSSILNDNEKQDIQTAIFVMLDFSLSLLANPYKFQLKCLQNPNVKEFYEMEYAPSNIEKLLIFSNIVPQKKLTQRTKIIIQNNFEYMRNLRLAHSEEKNNKNPSNFELEQKNKLLENDYFGNKNAKKRKINSSLNAHFFTYKYLEGVNNSIKYDVQITAFFPKSN